MPEKYRRLNILASFAYLRDDPYFQELLCAISPYVNVLIDSGAHTNHQIRIKTASGKRVTAKPVELKDYLAFLNGKVSSSVWQYIALDVIRNKKETDKNLAAMVQAGLKPMPVYIEGHTEKDLARLTSINERICVAGGVGSSDAYIRRRYRQIYELSGRKAKIHGLGYGRFPGTFLAAFSSCDSSSFNYGSRYGLMYSYVPRKGFVGMGWKDMASSRQPKKAEVRAHFIGLLSKTFGLTVQEMSNPLLYKGKDAQTNLPLVVGTKAYLDFMYDVQTAGKDYFIALPTVGFLQTVVAVAASASENYSYRAIVDIFRDMEAERRTSPTRGIAAMVNYLKKGTSWKLLPHSS